MSTEPVDELAARRAALKEDADSGLLHTETETAKQLLAAVLGGGGAPCTSCDPPCGRTIFESPEGAIQARVAVYENDRDPEDVTLDFSILVVTRRTSLPNTFAEIRRHLKESK